MVRKLGIFIHPGLDAMDNLNLLVPRLIELGVQPVIFNTKSNKKKKSLKKDLYFYKTELLLNCVEPSLKGKKISSSCSEGKYYSFDSLAAHYRIDCFKVPDVNDQNFLRSVGNDDQYIGCLSVINDKIFSRESLKVFKEKGFFWNVHRSNLRKYKGSQPNTFLWLHLNNESKVGVTLHELSEKIDTGNVLSIREFSLDIKDSLFEIFFIMNPIIVDLILKTLEKYLDRPFKASSKVENEGVYCQEPSSFQLEQLDKKGVCIVDSKRIIDLYLEKVVPKAADPNNELKWFLKEQIKKYPKGVLIH